MNRTYVGIAGSRDFNALYKIEELIDSLPASVIIVTGHPCRGVDDHARSYAVKKGISVIDIPALWEAHGKGAGFRRNPIIVDVSDTLYAFWDGKSKGTKHTIAIAESQNVPTVVINDE